MGGVCTRRPVFPLLGVVSPPADTQPPRRPCVLGSGDTPTPLAGTERSPGAPAPPNSRDEVAGAVAASTCARSGGAARAVAVRLLAVGLAPGEVSGAPLLRLRFLGVRSSRMPCPEPPCPVTVAQAAA